MMRLRGSHVPLKPRSLILCCTIGLVLLFLCSNVTDVKAQDVSEQDASLQIAEAETVLLQCYQALKQIDSLGGQQVLYLAQMNSALGNLSQAYNCFRLAQYEQAYTYAVRAENQGEALESILSAEVNRLFALLWIQNVFLPVIGGGFIIILTFLVWKGGRELKRRKKQEFYQTQVRLVVPPSQEPNTSDLEKKRERRQ